MKDLSLVLLGLFTGAIFSWFQFKYIWISQKILEAKLALMDEAAESLALYQREALDPVLQSNKRESINEYGSQYRIIELTANTDVIICKTLAKTKALFSKETYEALDKALKSQLKFTEPSGWNHQQFIDDRDFAINMMGDELKSNIPNLLDSLKKLNREIINR